MNKKALLLTCCLIVILTVDGIQFEERLVAYHRCSLDVHCQNISSNSFCFGNDNNIVGICKCKDGFELLSRNRTFFACLQYANYEESCEKDEQCYYYLSTNSNCDTTTNTCKCSEDSHRYSIDGRCYKTIGLGNYCQVDANCALADGTYGQCVAGKCDCKYDRQRPTEDLNKCIYAKELGELCDNDDQCSFIPNAVCRVSCRCASGYTVSRDGINCIQAATAFFQSCQENEQCSEFLEGSFCNQGNCTCPEGHHGFGSRCARSAGIGETCSGIEECIPDIKFANTANCTEGVCQCAPGAVDEYIGCNSCTTSTPPILAFVLGFLLYYCIT